MLRNEHEPRHSENGGICSIHDAIDEVEPGQCKAVERRLFSYVRRQNCGQRKGDEGVDIHGKLEGGQMESGQDDKDSEETANFVQEEGECDEGSAGLQAHDVEKCLRPRNAEKPLRETHPRWLAAQGLLSNSKNLRSGRETAPKNDWHKVICINKTQRTRIE